MEEKSYMTPVFSLTSNPMISQQDVQRLCSQGYFTTNAVASESQEILNSILGDNTTTSIIRSEAKRQLVQSQFAPDFVPTGSSVIDELFGGGLPISSIVELCGDRGVGKSTFCTQLCVSVLRNPTLDKVLFLSTDCSFKPSFVTNACERLNLNPNVIAENIVIHHLFSTDHLLQTLRSASNCATTQRYKLIVFDSFTGLFRSHRSRKIEQIVRKQIFGDITAALFTLAKLHNATTIIVKETDDGLRDTDDVLPWDELIPYMDSTCYANVILHKLVFEKSGSAFKATRSATPLNHSPTISVAYSVDEHGIVPPPSANIGGWMTNIPMNPYVI